MSKVMVAEFDVPDDVDVKNLLPMLKGTSTYLEIKTIFASVTWVEDRDGGALGAKMSGTRFYDVDRAVSRKKKGTSHVPTPHTRPTCRILGKPLDKHLIAQEVVRALAMVGLTAEAGRFGSWANDKDVPLDDVLAEADRLCQVC